MPDPESPGNADRLLEVPFEDLMKGNFDKSILNGARSNSNSSSRNDSDLAFLSETHRSNGIYADIDSNKSTRTNHDSIDGTNGVCGKCLREGQGSVGCSHLKDVIASINEINMDGTGGVEPRPYSRQLSDILLIPGPFEDQDKLCSPDESSAANIL